MLRLRIGGGGYRLPLSNTPSRKKGVYDSWRHLLPLISSLSASTCQNPTLQQFKFLSCLLVDFYLCLECMESSCSGNGKCVLSGEGDDVEIVCLCFPGWTGANCSVDIDFCDLNPCENGGTCVEKQESFICICPPEWTGRVCMTSEFCLN